MEFAWTFDAFVALSVSKPEERASEAQLPVFDDENDVMVPQ